MQVGLLNSIAVLRQLCYIRSMSRFNCPHCEALEEYFNAWESLEQIESCQTCGKEYQLIDSEGGPNALEAIAIKESHEEKV